MHNVCLCAVRCCCCLCALALSLAFSSSYFDWIWAGVLKSLAADRHLKVSTMGYLIFWYS